MVLIVAAGVLPDFSGFTATGEVGDDDHDEDSAGGEVVEEAARGGQGLGAVQVVVVMAQPAGEDGVEGRAGHGHVAEHVPLNVSAFRMVRPRPLNARGAAVNTGAVEAHATEEVGVKPVSAGDFEHTHAAAKAEAFDDMAAVPEVFAPE